MIRILIADDSELTRVVVRDLLSQDPNIIVICEVSDGRSAVEQTIKLKPDLVIMDVMMPIMNGLEAVTEIMAVVPTPILMLSANTDASDRGSAFAAIKLGALDVMQKPSGVITHAFSQIASQLIAKARILSRIRVIHHYHPQRKIALPVADAPARARRILAIGASTGGPKAVLTLLQGLPKDLPASVLIVQHIADGFAAGFADWLNLESSLPVRLAVDGDDLEPGQVLVAPNNLHLTVLSNRISLKNLPPLHSCRPSVDVMFHSIVDQGLAGETVAVLMTGMGSDGADGLALIRQKGGYTIAQDEASCAVFGMPKVAIERGATVQVLPLTLIGGTVCRLFAEA